MGLPGLLSIPWEAPQDGLGELFQFRSWLISRLLAQLLPLPAS